MKLVSPQSMETFPLDGYVYVELNHMAQPYYRVGQVDKVRAEDARKLKTTVLYRAWSRNAKPSYKEIEP